MGVIHLEKLVVKGPTPLKGEITINGAKNAAVAILPATLLIIGLCQVRVTVRSKIAVPPSGEPAHAAISPAFYPNVDP